MTLSAIGIEVISLIPTENQNIWDYIESISKIVIVLLGTIYIYRANGGENGSDFLGRYFSIGFVINIRLLLLLVPMSFALLFYYIYAFPEDEEIPSTALDVLPFLLWYLLLFWRVGKHVRDVRN